MTILEKINSRINEEYEAYKKTHDINCLTQTAELMVLRHKHGGRVNYGKILEECQKGISGGEISINYQQTTARAGRQNSH